MPTHPRSPLMLALALVMAGASVSAQQPEARSLPTGLAYDELRTALAVLRPIAASQPAAAAAGIMVEGPEIGGLVVDETVSKIGRDFYQVFYSAWQEPANVRSYTVRVQEQPAPGLGTRVVLLIDDEILGQIQLQPRYEVVEEMAQRAAAVVADELVRRRPVPSSEAARGGNGASP